jgi:hypothetical protein
MTQAAAMRRKTRTSKPAVAKSKPRGPVPDTDARKWLRENGYDDVADMIDRVMADWEENGVRTRRSWWVTLAGGANGRPYTVAGQEFPVLASAQRRQNKPVTPNAIQRNARETPPPARVNGRWPK